MTVREQARHYSGEGVKVKTILEALPLRQWKQTNHLRRDLGSSEHWTATQQTKARVDIVDNVKLSSNSALLRGISCMLHLKLPISHKLTTSYLYILSHLMPIETHWAWYITNR